MYHVNMNIRKDGKCVVFRTWFEAVWIIPDLWIMVCTIQIRNNYCILGDEMACNTKQMTV